MATTLDLVVNVIGWTPRAADPPSLEPQFVNPVAVRVYTRDGVRSAVAWLRLERGSVRATVTVPASVTPTRARCFCCTEREYEPRTHIERRRITSIDLVAEEARW